jgi:TonB-linked SusC/RagA family outer membrane protein
MKKLNLTKLCLLCQPLLFVLTLLLLQSFVITSHVDGQQVTGRVISADGEPMLGVSVAVKGTTQGAVTDDAGNFTLNVSSEDAVLVFSFVGYITQEIAVGSQRTINVTMTEGFTDLEEIVVIGYGTRKKSDLTGSVASVSSEDFNKGVYTSVDQAIHGRAPGVVIYETNGEPGAGMAIRIRGASSITAGNDPLFVIDGLPIDNSSTVNIGTGALGTGSTNPKNPLNTLDPSNIESVEILRDASATAIYGARGANGVILITTKRGAQGRARVDYSFTGSMSTTEKRYSVLTTEEYIKTFNEFAQELGDDPYFTAADIAEIGDGNDYQDMIFRTAYSQSHSLSSSGGNDRLRYNIMANYLDQQGLVHKNELKRYSLLTNLDSDITDRFKISLNLNVSQINDAAVINGNTGGERSGVITAAIFQDPTLPIFDETGRYYNSSDILLSNPMAVINGMTNDIQTNRAMGNIAFNYQFTEALSSNITLGMDQQNVRRDAFTNYVSYLGLVNNASGYVESLDRSNNMAQFTTSYHKAIGDNQEIQAVAGVTYQGFQDRRQTATASDFPTDVLGTDNMGLGDTERQRVGTSNTGFALMSYFGRINYNLSNFLLTGTIRADGSSRFGENNKYGYFPSFAFGWKLDEEDFIPELFSQMKLRLSWGLSGNQEISNFASFATYSSTGFGVYGNAQQLATGPSRLANPDLKWETTEQYNIGLDVGILANRITGDFNYFIKNTRDMLLYLPLPQSSGFDGQLKNIGSMTNRGFEASIVTTNVLTRNFNWKTTLNFATLHNEVTDIGGLDEIIAGTLPETTESITVIRTGLALNSYYGYNIVGIYQTDEEAANSAQPTSKAGYPIYEDKNGDGAVTELDKVILGNPFPDFTFGVRNTFTYKNIGLDIFLNGNVGNELFNGTAMAQGYPRTFRRNRNAEQTADRWTPENPDAKWPSGLETSQYGPGEAISLFVEDASYLRIRTVQLSYTIPTKSIPFIQRATVNITGGNLWTFTNYSGVNPEANLHGRDNVHVDFTTYPLARSFTLGVNLSF